MNKRGGFGHREPVLRGPAAEKQLELAEWEWLETGAYRRRLREW
jgi:hypothetical protein